jgi:hypothetical protein
MAAGTILISNKSKVQVFYTMLDNERLQEFNLVCANYDDYMLMRDYLKESVLQDADMFYYNWVWIEDFSNIANKKEKEADPDTLDVGLDLNIEHKWDFYGLQMNTLANPAVGATTGTFVVADNVAGSFSTANSNGGSYNHYTFVVTQKLLTVSPSGITVI